jgi:hypothetical protein
VSPMTILRRTKSNLWQKNGARRDQSAVTTPTIQEGTRSRDNPAFGEGWLVVENKGVDGKGPRPVTTLRLARGGLWRK